MHQAPFQNLSLAISYALVVGALLTATRMPPAPALLVATCAFALVCRRFLSFRIAGCRRRTYRRVNRRSAPMMYLSSGDDRQVREGEDLLRFSVFETDGPSRMGLMEVEPGAAVSGVRIRSLSFWIVLRVYVHGVWRGDVFLDAANGVAVQPGDLVSVSGTNVRLDALASFFQRSPTNPAHVD